MDGTYRHPVECRTPKASILCKDGDAAKLEDGASKNRNAWKMGDTACLYRNHRHYLLQRHLPRYSAIRPGAVKAGLHRGEAYYHSRDVSELHTADKWVQLGREVTPQQLGSPFKVVAKRGSKKGDTPAKDAGDAEGEASDPSALNPKL